MAKAVVKGYAYCLNHVPELAYHYGNTPYTERKYNPSDAGRSYLEKLSGALMSFEEALRYPPNQAYIGNLDLDALASHPRPWYGNPLGEASRFGRFGEIMPEDEFLGLMDICDVFDLVWLEEGFSSRVREKLSSHPLIPRSTVESRLERGHPLAEIEREISERHALPLYSGGEVVGCVRQGHEFDECLEAYVLLENIACKAGAVLACWHLLKNAGISAEEVDFVIECSEEAAGDMNQRGGGDFAKAIAEIAGLSNASGHDVRAFCAGPINALVSAAAYVASGARRNVLVVAGGAVPKLYMNSRDHVRKGVPPLEDCLGCLAVLVGPDDGVSPYIRLDAIGKHRVADGASPQAVTNALVYEPLSRVGLRISDVDKYAAELQNPEITVPAGAGDVPLANFKMIAALAAMKGEIKREEIDRFVAEHGVPGFAHTQGHIPSGVPFLGHACEWIKAGKIRRAMLIGKGSLFLARMTNLSEGISVLVEKNPGREEEKPSFTREDVRAAVVEVLSELLSR